MRRELVYLGHTISDEGIRVNDEKIKSITHFPTPTDAKAVRSFLGLSGFYRQFIKNYSIIAAPLSDLLKETSKFQWGNEQEAAFNTLKAKLSTPPVLAFPDFTKEFHLVTDACNIGIGSCLMQEYEGKRKDKEKRIERERIINKRRKILSYQ